MHTCIAERAPTFVKRAGAPDQPISVEGNGMARLRDEVARLRLSAYPRIVEIRATYADVDSFQHLNNVALARFFEEGRAAMNMELFGVDAVVRPSAGVQLLFASIAMEFLAQGTYPGSVTVATGV